MRLLLFGRDSFLTACMLFSCNLSERHVAFVPCSTIVKDFVCYKWCWRENRCKIKVVKDLFFGELDRVKHLFAAVVLFVDAFCGILAHRENHLDSRWVFLLKLLVITVIDSDKLYPPYCYSYLAYRLYSPCISKQPPVGYGKNVMTQV